MGLAKYAEDNTELYLERIYYKTAVMPEIAFQKTVTPRSAATQTAEAPTHKSRAIICRDCKTSFLFTAGEQRFYAAHHLQAPKRCAACRKAGKNNTERGFYYGIL